MKINRAQLLKDLGEVKPGLASREVIEQTTALIFDQGEVYTFNDVISINCETELDIGTFAIDGAGFYALIDKLKTDEIDISLKDGKLSIKAKGTNATIPINTDITIPRIEQPEKWESIPDNFLNAIKFCAFSVGKTMVKLHYTCFHFTDDKVETFDNHRLTVMDIGANKYGEFLLQKDAATQLNKYKPIEYAVLGAWVHFQNEYGVIYSARIIDAAFPDLSALIETEGVEVTLPDSLLDAVERAAVMAGNILEQDQFISITFEKDGLLVKGEGQFGALEETIKTAFKTLKKPFSIKVNPMHLMEILKHNNTALISEKTVLFKGENYVHVVSLIGE